MERLDVVKKRYDTQLTCFTGTKVQILTLLTRSVDALLRREAEARHALDRVRALQEHAPGEPQHPRARGGEMQALAPQPSFNALENEVAAGDDSMSSRAMPLDKGGGGGGGARPWSAHSSGRPSSGMLSCAQTPQLGGRSGSTSPRTPTPAQLRTLHHQDAFSGDDARQANGCSASVVRPAGASGRRHYLLYLYTSTNTDGNTPGRPTAVEREHVTPTCPSAACSPCFSALCWRC